jgi:hypothetical protein
MSEQSGNRALTAQEQKLIDDAMGRFDPSIEPPKPPFKLSAEQKEMLRRKGCPQILIDSCKDEANKDRLWDEYVNVVTAEQKAFLIHYGYTEARLHKNPVGSALIDSIMQRIPPTPKQKEHLERMYKVCNITDPIPLGLTRAQTNAELNRLIKLRKRESWQEDKLLKLNVSREKIPDSFYECSAMIKGKEKEEEAKKRASPFNTPSPQAKHACLGTAS